MAGIDTHCVYMIEPLDLGLSHYAGFSLPSIPHPEGFVITEQRDSKIMNAYTGGLSIWFSQHMTHAYNDLYPVDELSHRPQSTYDTTHNAHS